MIAEILVNIYPHLQPLKLYSGPQLGQDAAYDPEPGFVASVLGVQRLPKRYNHSIVNRQKVRYKNHVFSGKKELF